MVLTWVISTLVHSLKLNQSELVEYKRLLLKPIRNSPKVLCEVAWRPKRVMVRRVPTDITQCVCASNS